MYSTWSLKFKIYHYIYLVGALLGDGKYVDIPKHTSHSCAFIHTFIHHTCINHFHLVLCQSQTHTLPHCAFMCSAHIVKLAACVEHISTQWEKHLDLRLLMYLHMYINEFSELIRKIVIVRYTIFIYKVS